MRPFWRQDQIEDLALITLLDFRRRTGLPLAPPIDVDLVGEIACGLSWDWDVLPEPPGSVVWAGLYPRERLVVLNETHRDTFAAKSGLERFTKAHEIGHWILHVRDGFYHSSAPNATTMEYSPSATRPAAGALPRDRWLERHADWFAAALLMPASVFVPAAELCDLRDWKQLYRLAASFDVTITALTVRLQQLGLRPASPP
jgi:hypothetical protein